MNTISALSPPRCVALVAVCGGLVAAAVAPVALASAPQPKIGRYTSAKGQRSITFSVAKQHGRYEVTNFTIQCFVNANSFGAILVTGPARVSPKGSFAYTGTARHLANGTLAGSAKIKVSGKIVSSSKVTGTATFSKAKQSGCPAKAFTATVSKT